MKVRAARLSYVGEPGWELTIAAHEAGRVYEALRTAGRHVGIKPAGLLAQTSMRIEKGYLSFGHDITPDETPLEVGLIQATKLGKSIDFIGRSALEQRQKDGGAQRHMLTIVLDPSGDANPIGGEPIRINGTIRGRVTSAAYGFRIGRPICLGYLKGALSELEGCSVEVDIAGRCHPGRATRAAAFDPEGTRLRSGFVSVRPSKA